MSKIFTYEDLKWGLQLLKEKPGLGISKSKFIGHVEESASREKITPEQKKELLLGVKDLVEIKEEEENDI